MRERAKSMSETELKTFGPLNSKASQEEEIPENYIQEIPESYIQEMWPYARELVEETMNETDLEEIEPEEQVKIMERKIDSIIRKMYEKNLHPKFFRKSLLKKQKDRV